VWNIEFEKINLKKVLSISIFSAEKVFGVKVNVIQGNPR